MQTASLFLQGLYPPLSDTLDTESLVNGTDVSAPLDGQQYILVHGEDTNSPDTIWIKGDNACPAYSNASETYELSADYAATLAASATLYTSVEPLLTDILGPGNVSYANAYDVFDLLNVASIHNATVAPDIASSDLDQLRYYADEWEWNHNFNASQPDRSIGGMTFAGGILRQLDSVVAGSADVKFSLLAGSYDTFISFFGLTNLSTTSLNFTGLPVYASTMAFELFTAADGDTFPATPDTDLRVRFLFRNGTDPSEDLIAYPLWGETAEDYAYGDFKSRLGARAINNVATWCTTCDSTAYFCVAEAADNKTANAVAAAKEDNTGLSSAAASGIGVAVAVVVMLMIGGLVAFLMRRKSNRARAAASRPTFPSSNVEMVEGTQNSRVQISPA